MFCYIDVFNFLSIELSMKVLYDCRGAKLAKSLIIIAIFFTFTMPYYVFAEIGWKYLEPITCDEHKTLSQRTLLCSGVFLTGKYIVQYNV